MQTVIPGSSQSNRDRGEFALRRLGTVEDCAKVVEFLATDLSDYVTGAVIPIDGGLVADNPLVRQGVWWRRSAIRGLLHEEEGMILRIIPLVEEVPAIFTIEVPGLTRRRVHPLIAIDRPAFAAHSPRAVKADAVLVMLVKGVHDRPLQLRKQHHSLLADHLVPAIILWDVKGKALG
jgi:hypothetical protein